MHRHRSRVSHHQTPHGFQRQVDDKPRQLQAGTGVEPIQDIIDLTIRDRIPFWRSGIQVSDRSQTERDWRCPASDHCALRCNGPHGAGLGTSSDATPRWRQWDMRRVSPSTDAARLSQQSRRPASASRGCSSNFGHAIKAPGGTRDNFVLARQGQHLSAGARTSAIEVGNLDSGSKERRRALPRIRICVKASRCGKSAVVQQNTWQP